MDDLAAHDLVDPRLVDLQLPQRVGQLVGVAARGEVGGRALQHRHVARVVRAVAGHGRDERCRGRSRSDDEHVPVCIVEVVGPELGVHDGALEAIHAGPGGGVGLGVVVVALAHPQEATGEDEFLTGGVVGDLQGPAPFVGRPGGGGDRVLVADVTVEVVLVDDLAHVGEDLPRRSRSGGRSRA